jgi:hypothetical protein
LAVPQPRHTIASKKLFRFSDRRQGNSAIKSTHNFHGLHGVTSESKGDATCVQLLMIHTVEHREGSIARAIEQQTAKLPSDAFLWAAAASIATSLILKLLDRHHEALFVGQWAPTILILGLYNKLVKQHGSDQFDT